MLTDFINMILCKKQYKNSKKMKNWTNFFFAMAAAISIGVAVNFTGAIKGSLIAFGIVMFCCFLGFIIPTKK